MPSAAFPAPDLLLDHHCDGGISQVQAQIFLIAHDPHIKAGGKGQGSVLLKLIGKDTQIGIIHTGKAGAFQVLFRGRGSHGKDFSAQPAKGLCKLGLLGTGKPQRGCLFLQSVTAFLIGSPNCGLKLFTAGSAPSTA